MSKMKCFVIMPYNDEFDPVFKAVEEAAQQAVADEELECHWLKGVYAAGKITDDILESLQNATLCVADLTGSSPNVMWETGYAMALGKPTILIGQNVGELPFDLKVHRALPYQPDAMMALEKPLGEAVRQTLARYELKAEFVSKSPVVAASQAIAVTGSTQGDEARVRRRVETLLAPYLGRQNTWYCGSFGIVDEIAIQFLIEQQEKRVFAVGYNRYDLSPKVRQWAESHKIQFIDASVESLPKGYSARLNRHARRAELRSQGNRLGKSTRERAHNTDRDTFFLTKADLVMLFWDGQSEGTNQLLRFFEDNGKNALVGFI